MPPRPRSPGPLTWEELREQLDYTPKTGWLTWKVSKPRIRKGARAGNLHVSGHREITVCGNVFREHRLIWFWVTGMDPGDLYVDHKNRKRADNRWCNLRKATHGQNYVNSVCGGKMRGIQQRGNTWRVRTQVDGKRCSFTVGTYLAAKRLRNKLERQEWGEFACVRR